MALQSRGALLLLGCLAFSQACKEDPKPGTPPDLPFKVIDADLQFGMPSSDSAPATQLPAESDHLEELAGIWRGQADTQDFGLVRAEVAVDTHGQALSQLDGPTLHRSDLLTLTHWDGRTLALRMSDGTLLEVEAHLQSDEIELTLPLVGKVSLHRNGRGTGL